MYHEPVLCQAAVSHLVSDKSGIFLDGTLGGGGHAEQILSVLGPDGKYIGLDLDSDALSHAKVRLKRFGGRVYLRKANFRNFDTVLGGLGITKINGVLLDLGVTSHQIDAQERGFSYATKGPLDMRMDREGALSAYQLVNHASEQELDDLFRIYGEERRHRRVAHAIIERRKKSKIASTLALVHAVSAVLPAEHRVKSLARIFQALRIAVNRELDNLEEALTKAVDRLVGGGRIVVIAYQSLEDRAVKTFFKQEALSCVCPPDLPVCICDKKVRLKIVTRRPIRPSTEEIAANPRSRSARMRVAERTEIR